MVIRKYHYKFGVLRGRAPAAAHTDVSPSRRRPDNSNGLSENRPHGKLPDSRTNGNRLSATCQAGLCDRPPAARKVPYSVSQGGAGTGREGRTGAPSDASAEAAERGSPPRGERRRPGYSRLRIRIHAEGGHRSEHCTQPHRARAHAVPEGGVRGIGPRGAESSLRTPIVSCVQVLRAAGARGANRSRRLRATRSRRRSRGPCGCCSRA